MATRDLIFDIFAIDRASAVFSRVGAEAEGMGSSADKGSRMASAALVTAGAAVAFLGVKSVEMAGNFQASMTRLVTTAGESPRAIAKVSQGILDMAGKVGFSAQELATAMYQVESGGFHGAAGLKVLQDAAMGARVEGSNVTDVAHALAGALNDYRGSALTSTEATNAMTSAVGHGMMTFQDLAEAMPKIGARAAAAHVTFEEMLAALGTMTKDGLPAANAATYLGQTIGQLAAPTAKARIEMKGLGINATEVAQKITSGSGHGLSDAIDILYRGIQHHLVGSGLISVDTFKKMSTSTTAYQQVLAKLPPALQTPIQALATMSGGVRSFQGVLMLGGQHAQQYADTLHAVREQVAKGGTSVAGFSEVQGNFNTKLADAKGAASALAIEFGQSLMPAAEGVLSVVGGGISILLDHKGAVEALTRGLEIAAGAYLTIKAAELSWMAIQGAMAIFETASAFGSLAMEVSSASEAMTLMSMAWEATPVGAAAAVIGGVAAAAFALSGMLGGHTNPAIAAFNRAMGQVNQETGPSIGHIQSLATTYDTLKGSITKATYAMVEQDLERAHVIGAAQKLGISELTLVQASLGNAASIRIVNEHLAEWRARADAAAEAAARAKKAMQIGGGLVNGKPDPSGAAAAAKAAGDLAAKYAGLDQSIRLVQKAFSNEASSVDKSHTSWKNAALAASDAAGAFNKVADKADFINAPLVRTRRQVAELAAVFHLSGAEIQTVMRDEMVKGTVDGVQKMQDAIEAHKGGIHAAAVDLGLQLGYGAKDGIDSAALTVAQAAANMVDQAINAARHQAKIQSPSKRAHDEVGLQIGLGVAGGIDASLPSIQAAARRAADLAHKALMTGLAVTRTRLSQELTIDSAALAKVNQQIKAADAWSNAFKDNVFGAALTTPAMMEHLMIGGQSVTVNAGGQALPANATAAQTYAAMMAYEQAQAKKNAGLDSDVHRLRRLGISQAALDQMQQGGNGGIQEITALAAMNKAQVAAFNKILARSQNSLLDAGSYATANRSVESLRREQHSDARQVAIIKKALSGVHLTIANGGHTLRVTG